MSAIQQPHTRLGRWSEERLLLGRHEIERILRDCGLWQARLTGREHGSIISGMDLLPHIIEEEEWHGIEKIVTSQLQWRTALLNRIYSDRDFLASGTFPVEWLMHPAGYRRECFAMPKQSTACVWASVDLMRSQERWYVLDVNTDIPDGLGLAIQMRRVLAQALPEIFENRTIHPISIFPLEILAALRRHVPRKARLAALLEARTDAEDFDRAFVCRRMGLSVLSPADVNVREGIPQEKTISGLLQLHGLFRLVGDKYLDPITLDSRSGVSGLLDCVRGGVLKLLNPAGARAADLPVLLRWESRLARTFASAGRVELSALRTLLLSEPDELEEVRSHAGSYWLRRADGLPTNVTTLNDLLKDQPYELIAHKKISPDPLPELDKKKSAHCWKLRCFAAIREDSVTVMPGGLTLISHSASPFTSPRWTLRDTWVTDSAKARAPGKKRRPALLAEEAGSEETLSSRAAESLYWLGRYTERAELLARSLRVLMESTAGRAPALRRRFQPLWDGLGEITASKGAQFLRSPDRDAVMLNERLVFDRESPSSIAHSISLAHWNARQVPGWVSPECSDVLSGILRHLLRAPNGQRPAVDEELSWMLNQLASFQGLASRTLPRDTGFQFYSIGVHLERGINASLLIKCALCPAKNSSNATGGVHDEETDHEVLNALLRVFGVMDFYRRKYQLRSLPAPVAGFLLTDTENTVSVHRCIDHLSTALKDKRLTSGKAVTDLLANLTKYLAQNKKMPPALAVLKKIAAEFERLHEKLADRFFEHQIAGEVAYGSEGI